jgi:hypothetical protein
MPPLQARLRLRDRMGGIMKDSHKWLIHDLLTLIGIALIPVLMGLIAYFILINS